MRKIKLDICSNALTNEERFELVKKEAKIHQGELSHGNKATEFIHTAASIFPEPFREIAKKKIRTVVDDVIESFTSKVIGLISITKTGQHEYRQVEDISEALTFLDEDKKVISISAPHASGKTSKVAKVLTDQCLGKVAYVSHLKSIIEGACNNLNMTSYLSAGDLVKDQMQCGFPKNDALENLNVSKLAICINSVIGPLDDWLEDLDLLVIDEFTQVLSCIATSTLPNFKHQQVFDQLTRMVRSAKKVLVLDADMNDLAIRYLEFCCPEDMFQILCSPEFQMVFQQSYVCVKDETSQLVRFYCACRKIYLADAKFLSRPTPLMSRLILRSSLNL
uniref:hypothetical protein n=1 Tax=Vibrio alfacsensis TaxID=1074311 RepID=UPI0013E3A15B|nr:hypothetical protein [Vibrio alfacsensis]